MLKAISLRMNLKKKKKKKNYLQYGQKCIKREAKNFCLFEYKSIFAPLK